MPDFDDPTEDQPIDPDNSPDGDGGSLEDLVFSASTGDSAPASFSATFTASDPDAIDADPHTNSKSDDTPSEAVVSGDASVVDLEDETLAAGPESADTDGLRNSNPEFAQKEASAEYDVYLRSLVTEDLRALRDCGSSAAFCELEEKFETEPPTSR